jgi:DNA primase
MYLNTFVKKAYDNIGSHPEPLTYLYNRGLSREDIDKYNIGYTRVSKVHDDGSEDYKKIKEETFNFKGLQNRIIFPLKNVIGNVNGLVVRDLNRKLYTQFFLSEALSLGAFFGLYEAIPFICKKSVVFVHEGAINCISFTKLFPNTVSSLTSYLNQQQYETLKFFADKIVLVYDNDSTGIYGAQKVIRTYNDNNIFSINIGYKDSNECLQKLGLSKFEQYIKSKIPLFLR